MRYYSFWGPAAVGTPDIPHARYVPWSTTAEQAIVVVTIPVLLGLLPSYRTRQGKAARRRKRQGRRRHGHRRQPDDLVHVHVCAQPALPASRMASVRPGLPATITAFTARRLFGVAQHTWSQTTIRSSWEQACHGGCRLSGGRLVLISGNRRTSCYEADGELKPEGRRRVASARLEGAAVWHRVDRARYGRDLDHYAAVTVSGRRVPPLRGEMLSQLGSSRSSSQACYRFAATATDSACFGDASALPLGAPCRVRIRFCGNS